jgi:RNA polymerase sigma-32 factor
MNTEQLSPVNEAGNSQIGFEIHDSFRIYVAEISKHPMLTREEEVEIAERVHFHKEKEAEQRLVTSNLRLVVKIALQYSRFQPNLLDLIQEGNVGLVRAVKKFDPTKGTRFSTYASFWIRAFILKYIMDDKSMVKIGTKDSQRKLFFSLGRERDRIEKSGQIASADLIAEGLGVESADVVDMERRLYNGDVSLDEPLNPEGDSLLDSLSSGEDIEETVSSWEERELMDRWLGDFKKRLSPKDLFILERRIMSEDPMTLRDIGDHLSISRESVRQAETRISRNLVNNLRSRAHQSPLLDLERIRGAYAPGVRTSYAA